MSQKRFCKFNAPYRKNEPGRLPRLNAYFSYRDKSLNGSPAGLNHPGSNVENKTDVCMHHSL